MVAIQRAIAEFKSFIRDCCSLPKILPIRY